MRSQDRASGSPGHRTGFVPPPVVPGRETPDDEQRPPAPDAPAAWHAASAGGPRPVSPPPYPPLAQPPSLHEPQEQKRLGAWGWRLALAGLAVAFAPEMLLYLAVAGEQGGMTTTTVTVGTALVLVLSSFITYGWQLFAAWFFSLRRAAVGIKAWGFRKPTSAFFWTIPVAIFAVYAVSFFHELVVHPEQQAIVDQFPRTASGLALFFVLAVLMAPVFEEMFFRGFLFRGLATSWGWQWGAVVSAAIFGLAHLQLDVFVPLFALGYALAWVYHRTGSVWTSITLHGVFNGISVLAWYFIT